MKASDDLFRLIRSLSKSEKRYFKLYAAQHVIGEKNNYMRLFEAIEEQESYDQDALRDRFKNEKFIKHLSAEKNYLYKLILKSMRAYHAEKTVTAQIREMLQDATFLQKKGLYEQSERVLKKAVKMASKHEKLYFQLEIMDMQRRHVHRDVEKQPDAAMEKIIGLKNETMARLAERFLHQDIYDRVFVRSRMAANNGSQNNDLANIIEQAAAPAPGDGATLESHIAFHMYRAIKLQSAGNFKEAHGHHQAVVQIWEANPHIAKEQPNRYRIALGNYLVLSKLVGRYDEFPEIIEKIQSLPADSFDQQAESFQNTAYLQILYFINTGQPKAGFSKVPEIEAGLVRYRKKLSKARERIICYHIALMFLMAEDPSQALKWIGKILNGHKSDHRQDLYRAAWRLSLLLYLELGHDEVLESQFRAFKRSAPKKSQTEVDQHLTGFLNHALKHPDELRTAAVRFAEALTALEKSDRAQSGVGELLLWARSKAESRSMADLIEV